ncbi:DUF2214 family protein [bacterium]|nr:DUF2214 family protein [bacterium]
MFDAILAIIHHVFVFSLAGCLVGQWLLLMGTPSFSVLKLLGRVDAVYGIAATGSLAVGVARIFWGVKPASFYTNNPVFWTKMAVWGVVAILSIFPTIRFIQWGRRKEIPGVAEFVAVRKYVFFEILVFTLIPVFAALMARGYGYR